MKANNTAPVLPFLVLREWESEVRRHRFPELPVISPTDDVDFNATPPAVAPPAVIVVIDGLRFVPASELGDEYGEDVEKSDNGYRLKDNGQSDVMATTQGPLLWEYSTEQLWYLVEAAERLGVRAYDVAAYIVGTLHPDLGVLDSAGRSITTLDALPENTDGIDQHWVHIDHPSPLSVTPDDAARPGLPPTGPVESMQYLFYPDIREADNYGVRVEVSSDPEYAEVILTSLPRNIPPRSREQFAPLLVQRVEYTESDRQSDRRWGGSPDSWARASEFALGISAAVRTARTAIEQAVFAYARGEEWVCTLEPYRRAD